MLNLDSLEALCDDVESSGRSLVALRTETVRSLLAAAQERDAIRRDLDRVHLDNLGKRRACCCASEHGASLRRDSALARIRGEIAPIVEEAKRLDALLANATPGPWSAEWHAQVTAALRNAAPELVALVARLSALLSTDTKET